MSIFKDKVYEEMDWLEKACEPIYFELNRVLGDLPDEVELSYSHICSKTIERYGPDSFSADTFKELLNFPNNLNYEDKRLLRDCFNIVVEDEPIIDVDARTMTGGRVFVRKIKTTFDEKEVGNMIGNKGINDYIYGMDHKDIPTDRMNEILELLGLNEARRMRSPKQKFRAFVRHYEEIMSGNKWDIRDVGLSNRVAKWLRLYLIDGNLAAFSNFCKLKVMTNYDQPIYSIEGEEQV